MALPCRRNDFSNGPVGLIWNTFEAKHGMRLAA